MSVRSCLFLSPLALGMWSCASQDGGNAPEPIERAETADAAEPTDATAPAARPRPTPASQDGAQDPLDEEARRLQLIRERQQFLASDYIENGNALLDRGDLEGALQHYATALEVMPTNQEARDALRRVEALMGDRFAVIPDFMEDDVQRERVRRAQALIAAETASMEGDRHMRAGEYDQAIEAYRQAELVLRWHPLIATDTLDEQIIRNKLESALVLQEEAVREAAALRLAEAEEARERAEQEARNRRVNTLKTLYRESWKAYQREDYRQAENLARQILLNDPGNSDAEKMRDIAQAARHRAVDDTLTRDMREQWLRTMQDLEFLAVPQNESIVFDDIERWREVDRRQPLTFEENAAVTEQTSAQLILRRLEEVRIAPDFGSDGEGAPLTEVADFLQNLTGVNFIVSNKVRDELDEEQTSINLSLPERSVRKVLDLIAELSEELNWKIEDGVVKFVTNEEMLGGQVLNFYEVRDLIHPVRDFPGREINVQPSGGIEPLDEDFEEREALVVTADTLEGLIRDNVDPESWDADPNNALRITEQGVLVVNQTPEVHEKIQRLLDDLREATGIMVDIQTRFLNVEDNFLEDIGVDFRGLGPPGKGDSVFFNDFGDATAQQDLGAEIGSDSSAGAFYDAGDNGDVKARVENLYDIDLGDEDVLTGSGGLSFQWVYLNDLQAELILRAVSKTERVEIVTAPRVLVFNTARANLTVLNQVAYVQDFDVEIAQGASIADPIIAVIEEGVILDVRPVVSADRRFVTLELRPTVATLRRPILEVTTTLGSASSVTIQLPELEISRVRTSVPMPDGGTVMLGGMKLSERQDLRSGVPFLNKIPVISMLFERKGKFISKRKLLILLTAHIVIPQEHEPTPAQLGLLEAAPR